MIFSFTTNVTAGLIIISSALQSFPPRNAHIGHSGSGTDYAHEAVQSTCHYAFVDLTTTIYVTETASSDKFTEPALKPDVASAVLEGLEQLDLDVSRTRFIIARSSLFCIPIFTSWS